MVTLEKCVKDRIAIWVNKKEAIKCYEYFYANFLKKEWKSDRKHVFKEGKFKIWFNTTTNWQPGYQPGYSIDKGYCTKVILFKQLTLSKKGYDIW